jgi:hypothetical protein
MEKHGVLMASIDSALQVDAYPQKQTLAEHGYCEIEPFEVTMVKSCPTFSESCARKHIQERRIGLVSHLFRGSRS